MVEPLCVASWLIIDPHEQYGWDNCAAGVNVLLANITQEQRYKEAVTAHVDGWAWPEGYSGKKIGRTPEGLAYVAKWGSLRVAGGYRSNAYVM